MKKISILVSKVITLILIMSIFWVPVCAAGNEISTMVQPRYGNISSIALTLGFDQNNVAYCGISVSLYAHGSGISGLMRLYDDDGNCLAVWSVSDYDEPYMKEFTYQCTYGETYVASFTGYAYSNNGTAADRIEVEIENTCIDKD